MNTLLTLSQAIHVTCAALLVGGVFFFRVLLLKYACRHGGLSDELREALTRRWIHLAWNLLVVMLVTGLFQFTQSSAGWKGAEGSPSPHMIFGIKFLVFVAILAVLTLATTATGAKAGKRPRYLAINTALGILIVVLSAWLRRSY
ncbi:hypothetical protein HZA57_09270 [Candidatus Poribacteria bacterium]|nr:hypothetical protein [Candidatus Poribacteria bacterium]